jgi:hypothetical protein
LSSRPHEAHRQRPDAQIEKTGLEVQFRVADARGLDAYAHLARPGGRGGNLLQPKGLPGLNDVAFWRCIPARVWSYTLGGYR